MVKNCNGLYWVISSIWKAKLSFSQHIPSTKNVVFTMANFYVIRSSVYWYIFALDHLFLYIRKIWAIKATSHKHVIWYFTVHYNATCFGNVKYLKKEYDIGNKEVFSFHAFETYFSTIYSKI
jgi:hypothetical protein